MLSKSQIKLIKSLSQKKFRQKNGLFIAEGRKTITELLTSRFNLFRLFTEEAFPNAEEAKTQFVSASELKKISQLFTPQTALAVFEIPNQDLQRDKGLHIVLDGVRDPGNLGTIIRLADWFGVSSILCSADTVDCYNPKVIQASMGSISRVPITYGDIGYFLKQSKQSAIFGAFMEGESVYTLNLPQDAFLILGNEANGISKDIEELIDQKISIPQFGHNKETESLNVATATAILLSEFRRQF